MLSPAEKMVSDLIVAPSLVACGVGAALSAVGIVGLANNYSPLPDFMHHHTGIKMFDSLQSMSPLDMLLGGLLIAVVGLGVLKAENVMRDMVVKGRMANTPVTKKH
jgi:hypothetical protein